MAQFWNWFTKWIGFCTKAASERIFFCYRLCGKQLDYSFASENPSRRKTESILTTCDVWWKIHTKYSIAKTEKIWPLFSARTELVSIQSSSSRCFSLWERLNSSTRCIWHNRLSKSFPDGRKRIAWAVPTGDSHTCTLYRFLFGRVFSAENHVRKILTQRKIRKSERNGVGAMLARSHNYMHVHWLPLWVVSAKSTVNRLFHSHQQCVFGKDCIHFFFWFGK